jgi:hypothetical protein
MSTSRVHPRTDLSQGTRFGCAFETVVAVVLMLLLGWLTVRACSQPAGVPAPVIPPEPYPLRAPYP